MTTPIIIISNNIDLNNKTIQFDNFIDDLSNQTPNLPLYLVSCLIAIVWTIYILFFNSRLVGYLVTLIINLILKRKNSKEWIKITGISISLLSGKLMFKGVHYVCIDYMIYIQEGWLTFAYWRPVYSSSSSCDENKLNNSPNTPNEQTHLFNDSSQLNANDTTNLLKTNIQLHYYNSWKVSNNNDGTQERPSSSSNSQQQQQSESALNSSQQPNDIVHELMHLFSSVNIKIEKGRVYFGNKTLPSTLLMRFSSAKLELNTEKSQSSIDDYCYILKGDLNKFEMISIINNKQYLNELNNNSNRQLILKCLLLSFEYIQDVPTILTFDRRRVGVNGDGLIQFVDKEPEWKLIVNCIKQTQFNYGPWYDLQREHLWKFFFPQTYETLEPQRETTELNERRQITKFDLIINLQETSQAQVNIEFNGYDPSNVTHKKLIQRVITFKCKQQSKITCSIPWIAKTTGYETNVNCLFNSVVSYTNMSFKHFLSAEKLELNLDIKYPLVWNNLQKWLINLNAQQTTLYLVFEHKFLFQDLVNDWSSKVKSDLRSFVPYIYELQAKVNDMELILPCNQHNWIDTNKQENNSFLSLLGSRVAIQTSINFEEFLPEEMLIDFEIRAQDICAKFIIPETNSNLIVLKLLRQNLKYISTNGVQKIFDSQHWSKYTNQDEFYLNDYDTKVDNKHFKEDWFECAQSESINLKITYKYHPQALIDFNDLEYSPTALFLNNLNILNDEQLNVDELFDSDRISVKVEIGPCVFMVYGTFLKHLWFIKEAYFSWDQLISEIQQNGDVQKLWLDKTLIDLFDKRDKRNFRPLSVDVSLAIHQINGHLVLDSNQDPFPIGFTDRLCFELEKSYHETKLQLYVNPINLFLMDSVQRPFDKNIKQGHLCLSSINVRGHAMFSDYNRPKTDTLEYAWLLEIVLGDITGHLTPVQSEQLIHFLETFLQLILDNEYDLREVYSNRLDPGLPYKYCVTRFSIDLIDLYLVEIGTALNLQLYPIRVSLCDTHTNDYAKGVSAYIQQIQLKQFLNEKKRDYQLKQSNPTTTTNSTNFDTESLLSTSSSITSASTRSSSSSSSKTSKKESVESREQEEDSNEYNYWFECACIQTGEILLDMQLDKGNRQEQLKFLRDHDKKTKRLYFLWDKYYDYELKEFVDLTKKETKLKCGCINGCYFYSIVDDYCSFFKTNKPLSLSSKFAKSLFFPNEHVLNSQFIMKNKYNINLYKYELIDESSSTIINTKSSFIKKQKPKISTYLNDKDDYFTASEDDDDEDEDDSNEDRKLLIKKQPSKASSIDAYRSLNGSNSSVVIKIEDNKSEDSETLSPSSKNDNANGDDEFRISLKYDMLCPIIDSGLPKYCYVKNLSHASVSNWNLIYKYPYFNDNTNKNIMFDYKTYGFSCALIDTLPSTSTTSSRSSTPSTSFTKTDSNNDNNVKCKANLTFVSNIQGYVTPLALFAVENYLKSLKSYKIHSNTLLTELNTKCQTHCASNSIIQVISRTQVSLKIPKILLCSLQVGLSEDKNNTSFITPSSDNGLLIEPDELSTLSLMILCLHSIEVQLIDSNDSTAALFKIDKIDTQFKRLHNDDNNLAKLSCISSLKSKVSFNNYFKQINNINICKLSSSIMYECAFERISIKGIKSPSGKMSLCEFDILNIWFSFPEPPVSPKGKRKIPYTKYEWNLLSSLSPAIVSWVLAIKRLSQPFRTYLELYNIFKLNLMCVLIAGSLKYKDNLLFELTKIQSSNSIINNKYLKDSSQIYLNDSNCYLVKLLRIYLLNYKHELLNDFNSIKLNINNDIKYLKKVINDLLKCWSTILYQQQQQQQKIKQQQLNDNDLLFDDNDNHLINESIIVDFNIDTGKINTKINKQQQQQQQKSQNQQHAIDNSIKLNINEYFKPIFDFIGIDAPSGTLTDNLFKQFGSLLIGNLNIKSVDINILSSNSYNNDITTTILSFDSLLLNINVRQEFSSLLSSNLNNYQKGQHTDIQQKNSKYFTKIDTGIHLNYLKQEINMPLLRLVHQFYTIAIDANDYLKEQELILSNSFTQFNILSEFQSNIDIPHQYQAQSQPQQQTKDILSFINSVSQSNNDYFYINNETANVDTHKKKRTHFSPIYLNNKIQQQVEREHSKVSLFGYVNINMIKSRASLGNLVFNGQMKNIQLSLIFGKKLTNNRQYEGSFNLRMHSTHGKFTEIDNNDNIIVELNIERSHLFGILNKQQNTNDDFISSFVHIGKITIDVPLRPIDIHSVVYRESMLIGSKIIPEFKNLVRQDDDDDDDNKNVSNENIQDTTLSNNHHTHHNTHNQLDNFFIIPNLKRTSSNQSLSKQKQSIKLSNRLLFDLKLKLDGCELKAKLLEKPCLKASYLLNTIELNANNLGKLSKLNCILYDHCLSFECEDLTNQFNDKLILTKFNLPGIHVNGNYISYNTLSSNSTLNDTTNNTSTYTDTSTLLSNTLRRVGTYSNKLEQSPLTKQKQKHEEELIVKEFKFNIKINKLNHELNAELIAQLVFVTKVFINEINHILTQVVTSKPSTTTTTTTTRTVNQASIVQSSGGSSSISTCLYHYTINIDIGKITITALTPSNISLTLSTGDTNIIKLNNDFYFKYKSTSLRPSIESIFNIQLELKTFNSSMDQCYQLASFEAKFDLKNAIKINTQNLSLDKKLNIESKEALIINVDKPRFYIQPGAVDNAILLYLNYRSTYEFWIQQRQPIHLFQQAPLPHQHAQQQQQQHESPKSSLSSLSFKIKLNSLGVALPLFSNNKIHKEFKTKLNDCLIITLQETNIYACSNPFFVSKGEFNNFCLRFVDTFDLSNSEWVPFKFSQIQQQQQRNHNLEYLFNNNLSNNNAKLILNSWLVPQGSYEICSSTIQQLTRPLWLLDVKWKMEGIDVNLDTSIGAWFSKLSSTITRLTDTQFISDNNENNSDSNNDNTNSEQIRSSSLNDHLNSDELMFKDQKDREMELKKLKNELFKLKSSNDDKAKINELQLKIDKLSVASYPDKAKKILAKTRNNLKEQFGFNTQSPTTPTAPSPIISNDLSTFASPQSVIRRADLISPSIQHSRSKSGDINNTKTRHSLSNEDSSLSTSSSKKRSTRQSIIEENESPSKQQQQQQLGGVSSNSGGTQQTAAVVDFKLDVKIEIKSGKCVLYALPTNNKQTKKHEQQDQQNYNYDNNNLTTNFIFPAIRCKAFYESKHYENNNKTNGMLIKKANLYSSIKLDSFVLPQSYMIQRDYFKTKDMCLSPVLLDFLEQTLEFIPTNPTIIQTKERTNSFKGLLNPKASASPPPPPVQPSQHSSYQMLNQQQVNDNYLMENNSYFPIDVVVIVSMLPSNIRFTCQPQSTIECLLKLPQLDLVFSTKNSNDTINTSSIGNNEGSITTTGGGGLSVTCCLTDFSLKFYNNLAKPTTTSQFNEYTRYYEQQSRYYLNDDKDSLSVRVEFIKINISRSRRLMPLNDVKLSVIADIGRASFTYDMRNIKEIFIFPKIWYRQSLTKRLFLGAEESMTQATTEKTMPTNTQKQTLSNEQEISTLVLVSINLAELEVKMNVGSILGYVSLLTNKARSFNKILINNKDGIINEMKFNFILDDTRLISDGGSNGCMLRIKDISSFIDLANELTNIKHHKADFNIYAIEFRVDNAYNHTTPILACRLSNLYLKLNDLWSTTSTSTSSLEAIKQVDGNKKETRRVLIELNVLWDQFHLMITRSTTPDLIVLYYKLSEYLNKQLNESKDYIQKECDFDLFYEMKLKQQFMNTNLNSSNKKDNFIKKYLNSLNIPGGNIQLKGNNFTLILFDGNNFKAKNWALFSLNETTLEFSSEESNSDISGSNSGNESKRIQQDLLFYLGKINNYNGKHSKITSNNNMASIYLVHRESTNLYTQFKTINDWFQYAHSTIDSVGLREFPLFNDDDDSLLINKDKLKPSSSNNNTKKKTTPDTLVKWEEVFHLPALQIYFTSTQFNLNKCTTVFTTEFHDHILISLRMELLLQLRDIIKAYLKESDLLSNSSSSGGGNKNIKDNKLDLREYECIKWELEPTVRFILRLGQVGDSLGVDTVLKHLGLTQAKSTIPKWIQRGLMDNANNLLEYIINLYFKLLPDSILNN